MTRRRIVSCAVALAIVTPILARPIPAVAAVYPGTKCISSKLKDAGKKCKAVLKAWSSWDKSGDSVKRDAALAAAAAKFDLKWQKSEDKAANKGADCVEATLDSTAMEALIDGHIATIVSEINAGLNLGNSDDARCGAALLKAAANKCASFLKSESSYLKKITTDPQGIRRAEAQLKASTKFSSAWASATADGCPTTATEAGIEGRVDTLSDDVVTNSTTSPGLATASFTTITPGGGIEYENRTWDTTCVENTPYHFFVRRGTVNKLLMYYQGGGACWNHPTCGGLGFATCDQTVDPLGSDNPNNVSPGFADGTNPLNPFKDWHVVFVSYCTCDIHWGEAQRLYSGGGGPIPAYHFGYPNAKVAEKYAREHFVSPDEVFVTGSSAGAYGASLHGTLLHLVYPGANINTLADAGNGVITQDFLENNFPTWGVEPNIPSYIPGLDIPLDQLSIPDFFISVANYYPQSNWAHYTTAYDGGSGGQTGFYNVMLNPSNVPEWPLWWHASCAWNPLMRQQAIDTAAAVPANYRYYIGTGSRHTMFGSDKVYTDTTGGVPTVVDWVNEMRTDGPGWVNVEASNFGLLLPGDPQPSGSCVGGSNDGGSCTVASTCPGGVCDLPDPFEQQGSDIVINCP